VNFDNLTEDAKLELMSRAQNTFAWNTRMTPINVKPSVRKGSIILDMKMPGNPGWSQEKTDLQINTGILNGATQFEMVDIVEQIPSIAAATTSGKAATVEPIVASRVDQPTKAPTRSLTPAPPSPPKTPAPTRGPEELPASGAVEKSVFTSIFVAVVIGSHPM
jgi:hypothetical protein